jgi:hypothetical protein
MSETITATTAVLEKGMLCKSAGERCEICPDINFDRPADPDSDCEYYEIRSGTPICTRQDGMQQALTEWIAADLGSLACPNLLEMLEHPSLDA